jgi:hypothetical protein
VTFFSAVTDCDVRVDYSYFEELRNENKRRNLNKKVLGTRFCTSNIVDYFFLHKAVDACCSLQLVKLVGRRQCWKRGCSRKSIQYWDVVCSVFVTINFLISCQRKTLL